MPISKGNTIHLNLYQGNITRGETNKIMATINIDGILNNDKCFTKIDFNFIIDQYGILHVTAIENSTSKRCSIQIQGFEGLSINEIEKPKENANRSSI